MGISRALIYTPGEYLHAASKRQWCAVCWGRFGILLLLHLLAVKFVSNQCACTSGIIVRDGTRDGDVAVLGRLFAQ